MDPMYGPVTSGERSGRDQVPHGQVTSGQVTKRQVDVDFIWGGT